VQNEWRKCIYQKQYPENGRHKVEVEVTYKKGEEVVKVVRQCYKCTRVLTREQYSEQKKRVKVDTAQNNNAIQGRASKQQERGTGKTLKPSTYQLKQEA
jgi:hypothetical protein